MRAILTDRTLGLDRGGLPDDTRLGRPSTEGGAPMSTPNENDLNPSSEGGAPMSIPNENDLNPPVRNDAPDTSQEAAGNIAPHTPGLRSTVYAALCKRGAYGATDQELQDELQLPSNTEVPRRWELVKQRLVVASGKKRRTRSGCPAIVWVLPEFAPNTPRLGGAPCS